MTGARRLSIPAFIAIVVVDLAILQGVGALGQAQLDGFEEGRFRTSEEVALGLLLPVGLSVAFVYAVVAALGWWRPVLVDDRPVQRRVWVVPVVFGIAVLLAIDYAAQAETGAGFVLLLLLAALCVGFGEEGMFRGIGVTTFRVNGFSEGRVALWSSAVGEDETYAGSLAAILAYPLVGGILLAWRRRIELSEPARGPR